MEYPYQIVAFLDTEPTDGQLIYGDENGGWFAQVALKRRFALKDVSEDQLVQKLGSFCASTEPFDLKALTVQKPERMPVEVIMVEQPSAADTFHQKFLQEFGQDIVSKYPDREGENYFPHITAQYWGKYVIDVVKYENREFSVGSVWLVKDSPSEQDTRAFEQFPLKRV